MLNKTCLTKCFFRRNILILEKQLYDTAFCCETVVVFFGAVVQLAYSHYGMSLLAQSVVP